MRMLSVALLFTLGFGFPVHASTQLDAPTPAAPNEPPAAASDGTSKPIIAPPSSRGQMLYENHCAGCHESVVHIRSHPRVKSLAELRGQVLRWTLHARLDWRSEEIEDVVQHLNRHYYKFETQSKD